MSEIDLAADAAGGERNGWARRITLQTLATIFVVAGILHLGSAVFLPLAIATLIAFALSPAVHRLRTGGLPRTLAVLVAVTVTFAVLGAILAVMAGQLTQMLEELPTFQTNILAKLESLQAGEGASGVLGRFIDMLGRISEEIGAVLPTGAAPENPGAGEPVQVAVVEVQSIWRVLQDVVVPIISPIITTGLVVVVVIFMLVEQEELRYRFIRLVGSNDLHRTTEMLEDAGSRVASYLLTQLLVNVIYAVPIGLGLWIIGVPNPALWALMTLVLRFVPYVGTVISAAAPLFLAFAVSPDWSMVLWTIALFLVVELITSNFVEPWLYGSRTGLSPLAVIIAAILWTWIWGPMGLILSTPLTVCLVVLGRYLPQFEVFDILFGDEPVLAPHARLYQRLLVGEVVESASRAEEALETAYLADYYQEVCIPALLLAQADYERGVLSQLQEERIAGSARQLVQALDHVIAEELEDPDPSEAGPNQKGKGARVLVSGGRNQLDDVAAAMLAQAMQIEGAVVTALTRTELMAEGAIGPSPSKTRCLVLNYLDPDPARASLLVIRRLKRAHPGLRVGVVIWQMPAGLAGEPGQLQVQTAALQAAEAIGADFAATTLDDAVTLAFADEKAKPLGASLKPPRRRPVKAVAEGAPG